MGTIKILSNSATPFANREEAARELGEAVIFLKEAQPVVLGIPCGGMVIAHGIARTLNAPVDIVLSRKLRAPYNPELAFGALTENGETYLNRDIIRQLGIDQGFIEKEQAFQLVEIQRRREIIRRVKTRINLKDCRVIVTDDGVATGATMMSALWAVRHENASYIVCAVPVGAKSSLVEMSQLADEVVCLKAPTHFYAVGQFYRDFPQLSDEELLGQLAEDNKQPKLKLADGSGVDPDTI